MSKQIELEILEAMLKRHLEEPLKFLCIHVHYECRELHIEDKGAVSLTLREEIMSFLNGEKTVENFVDRTRGVGGGYIHQTGDHEVVAMRTHILETMIARRKKS